MVVCNGFPATGASRDAGSASRTTWPRALTSPNRTPSEPRREASCWRSSPPPPPPPEPHEVAPQPRVRIETLGLGLDQQPGKDQPPFLQRRHHVERVAG